MRIVWCEQLIQLVVQQGCYGRWCDYVCLTDEKKRCLAFYVCCVAHSLRFVRKKKTRWHLKISRVCVISFRLFLSNFWEAQNFCIQATDAFHIYIYTTFTRFILPLNCELTVIARFSCRKFIKSLNTYKLRWISWWFSGRLFHICFSSLCAYMNMK